MPKIDPNIPNIYVFGRAHKKKWGGSVRQGMTLFLLARLPAEIVQCYIDGEFKNEAEIWGIAKRMGVAPGNWGEK